MERSERETVNVSLYNIHLTLSFLSCSTCMSHFSSNASRAKAKCKCGVKSLSSVKQVGKKSNRAVWDSRFSFPSVHFNHVFHISSIFSTRVTLSCEPQRDKCNYLTLCFTRPHINMPVLSAENRDNNRRKCERSSSHNCCFTVRLDRRSDNIQKKKHFLFSLVYLQICHIAHNRADCSTCT